MMTYGEVHTPYQCLIYIHLYTSDSSNTTHTQLFNSLTVAVATPCCPAPVSAIIRSFPSR